MSWWDTDAGLAKGYFTTNYGAAQPLPCSCFRPGGPWLAGGGLPGPYPLSVSSICSPRICPGVSPTLSRSWLGDPEHRRPSLGFTIKSPH